MSEITNYLPFNRKIFKHEFWNEKRVFSRFEAWTDLLQTARFEEAETRMLIGNTVVKWGRGELVASLRFLAERWGWSKNKVDSFLKLLISEGMIAKRTAEGTPQTVITICKYDTYNAKLKTVGTAKGHDRDSTGTASGQDRDKSNKEKKVKRDSIFSPPSLDDVKTYFLENSYPEKIAIRAFKYYHDADWHDSKGNPVKTGNRKCREYGLKRKIK